MENPIKMDDLGGPPLFLETSIYLEGLFPLKVASFHHGFHLFWRRRTVVGYDDMTRHGIMFFLSHVLFADKTI